MLEMLTDLMRTGLSDAMGVAIEACRVSDSDVVLQMIKFDDNDDDQHYCWGNFYYYQYQAYRRSLLETLLSDWYSIREFIIPNRRLLDHLIRGGWPRLLLDICYDKTSQRIRYQINERQVQNDATFTIDGVNMQQLDRSVGWVGYTVKELKVLFVRYRYKDRLTFKTTQKATLRKMLMKLLLGKWYGGHYLGDEDTLYEL